ncbi:MAG: transglutaminase domain-containing protein [Blautia sp.]|nr:transglutaminase domain-containing protein [Blautia sp.]
MKAFRLIRIFFLFCVFLLLSGTDAEAASKKYEKCNTLEELEAYLGSCREQKLESFNISCSSDLFEELKQKDFLLLLQTEVLSRISDRELNYYQDGRLMYTAVTYTDIPSASCPDLSVAEEAIAAFVKDKCTSFNLVCSEDVYQVLFTDSHLWHMAAKAGIEEMEYSGSSVYKIIYAEKVTPFSVPYTYVEDGTEFLKAFSEYHKEKLSEFAIVADPSFFAQLMENDFEELNQMQALSQLDTYKWTSRDKSGIIHYSGISFVDIPRILCDSEDDMVNVIRQMGAEGITDFDLVLPSVLYKKVSSRKYSLLNEIQKKAGIFSYSYRTSYDSLCIIGYLQAEIASDVRQITTISEAAAYLQECTEREDQTIYLFCTKEVYRTLLYGTEFPDKQQMYYIADLMDLYGVLHYYYQYSDTTSIITLKDLVYYPGTVILHAIRDKKTDSLEGRMKETFLSALDIAERANFADPSQKARFIHDELCSRISYYKNDYSDDDDGAVGALLDGKANCDGYSDAFYLAATLSGLHVRYQHGNTFSSTLQDPSAQVSENIQNEIKKEESTEQLSDETHMWNLVKINDLWYAVDVTWDDQEDAPDCPSYRWFLSGEDRIGKTHYWNHSMTAPLAQTTDLTWRPRPEYIISADTDFQPVVDDIFYHSVSCAEIYFQLDNADERFTELFPLMHSSGAGNITYKWDKNMDCLFLTRID